VSEDYIELCCATDHVFSPYVDGLRTSVGKEYEVRQWRSTE
jgi:hypothetical protein